MPFPALFDTINSLYKFNNKWIVDTMTYAQIKDKTYRKVYMKPQTRH